MLNREFQYYLDHQDELVKQYNGKVLVIVGEAVVGVFDSELTAYVESKKTRKLGTFLMQQCSPGAESYTKHFHSRVVLT